MTKTTEKPARKMITVKQIGSPMRRPHNQELCLKALGLGKMNRVRTLVDSPSVQGLIRKVQHMVVVIT